MQLLYFNIYVCVKGNGSFSPQKTIHYITRFQSIINFELILWYV